MEQKKMSNNYIKVSFNIGEQLFFFNSRAVEEVRAAHDAAISAKIKHDTYLPRSERSYIGGRLVQNNKARLSIWKRCGALHELPEIGEYSAHVPTHESAPTS